ncbi:MAG TPA: EVE domain-containing protein [Vicinamibacterales bacterium]|nr:EVE domain-containing protein [Vicinamibacterales bacterium]
MNFLFKEEPESYSFDAFLADKRTTWTGVRNPAAQKHLREVRKGDRIFYYHTGNEKAVVGIAKAVKNAYLDPNGEGHVVDIVPVKRLRRPVTLAEIKKDRRFAKLPLVRVPRLSVMPIEDGAFDAILTMSGTT